MNDKIRLGVNPIGWSNDDLKSLGGEVTLEHCLEDVVRIGYEGIELGHKFPRDKRQLKETLEAYGVSCVSGWYSGFLGSDDTKEKDEIERASAHCDLLKAQGCKLFIYGEMDQSIQGNKGRGLQFSPVKNERQWVDYGKRLNAFGGWFKDKGMTLVYHHHMGTYTQDKEGLSALMKHTDPELVSLLFDTGHAAFGGIDIPWALAKYGPRIKHVHLKDVRRDLLEQAQNENWSFLESVLNGVFTVPGDGHLDFKKIVNIIKNEIVYAGWLVVEAEQDPCLANSFHMAQKGYDHIKTLLGKNRESEEFQDWHLKARSQKSLVNAVNKKNSPLNYVGFEIISLDEKNYFREFQLENSETCVVLLNGKINIRAGEINLKCVGKRNSVFEDCAPYAFYIPPKMNCSIEFVDSKGVDTGKVEIALCRAPSMGTFPERVITPQDIQKSNRGAGSNLRFITDILPESAMADSLLVVEVITPAGNSSSYPPHKHDTDNLPEESHLEEIYFHKVSPEQGFVFQRIYTEDRSVDKAYAVENNDCVVVPYGHHPVCAPHGYKSYYLNVMAGPKRVWKFKNDPQHEWMLS